LTLNNKVLQIANSFITIYEQLSNPKSIVLIGGSNNIFKHETTIRIYFVS